MIALIDVVAASTPWLILVADLSKMIVSETGAMGNTTMGDCQSRSADKLDVTPKTSVMARYSSS